MEAGHLKDNILDAQEWRRRKVKEAKELMFHYMYHKKNTVHYYFTLLLLFLPGHYILSKNHFQTTWIQKNFIIFTNCQLDSNTFRQIQLDPLSSLVGSQYVCYIIMCIK